MTPLLLGFIVLSGLGTWRTACAEEGWNAVERYKKVPYDLESTPIQIKTNGAAGSAEYLRVNLRTAAQEPAGGVYIGFGDPLTYRFVYCHSGTVPFPPGTLPSEEEKVWIISEFPGPRVTLQCNGVTVVDLTLSDETCGESDWGEYWNRKVETIEFDEYEDASDGWRIDPYRWKEVEREVYIPFDLESTPLQIKTSQEDASEDELDVTFYTADEQSAGNIVIGWWEGPFEYKLYECTSSWTNLEGVPSGPDKLWTIKKILPGPRIVVLCNGVTVLDFTMSDDTCSEGKWSSEWNVDVALMRFYTDDSASDEWGPVPVDGRWSETGEWSTCDAECGGGTQTRSNTCTNPAPQYGGAECEGDADETMACNEDPCPEEDGDEEDCAATFSCEYSGAATVSVSAVLALLPLLI